MDLIPTTWRPVLLADAAEIVRSTTSWPLAVVTRSDQVDTLDRALDEPSHELDGPPRDRVLVQAACMCQQLLQLTGPDPGGPEPPRATEAVLHRTLERSGIELLGDRLSMVVKLQGWGRGSRDMWTLCDLLDQSLVIPSRPHVDEFDWEGILWAYHRQPVAWDAIASDWKYRLPTFYAGDLLEIPEYGSAAREQVMRVRHVIEAVLRCYPQPHPVAVATELTPPSNPRQAPRHRPPRRADAHIVVGRSLDSVDELDALHAALGPKIILDQSGDGDGDVELARWLYTSFETMLATYRRRLNHALLMQPRLAEFSGLVMRASDRALRSAAHRSDVSIETMKQIVSANSTDRLGDIPTHQMDRLLASLRASASFAGRHRPWRGPQPRIRYGGLRAAARARGWNERTKTRLRAAAERELSAPTIEHRLDLITPEDWIAFYERLYGDR